MTDCQRFTEINGGEIWGQNGLICTLNVDSLLTADAARAMKAIIYALELEFGELQDGEGESKPREFWIDTDEMLAHSDDHREGFVRVREVLPE